MSLPIERTQLDGIMVFLAVAESHSFRAAARQLQVTPSAVSQAIRSLELRVGAPLFHRTTRTVGLTEAGERLLDHAKPALDLLGAGLEAARRLGSEASGLLRVNVPRPVLPLLINRLFPGFSETYPAVQLELFGENRLVDIVAEGFDAGIRMGHFVETDMIAVRLSPPIRFAVVGAPSYFAKQGRPRYPDNLGAHRCVLNRHPQASIYDWEFVIRGKTVKVPVSGPLIVNDIEGSVRAAFRGVGLAYLPVSLALSYIAAGQLEEVLTEFAVERPPLTLYYPSRKQALPKLRAFVDFARTRMQQEFKPGDYLPMTL